MTDEDAAQGARRAIDRMHAAMMQVVAGDVSAIKALYSRSDEATGFFGWGGYEKGWQAVARRWDWAAAQFKGGTVSYQNLTTVITADLAYTTDIETFRVRVADADGPSEWANRVTHVFRREGGEWRLIHRHGNRLEPQATPSARQR